MRKQKLITAIRETIIDLQTGRKEYSWICSQSCNCGILSQNLNAPPYIGKVEQQSGLSFYGSMALCHQTGKQYSKVIEVLLDAGMTYKDIIHLENLGDVEILKEAGLPMPCVNVQTEYPISINRSTKESVILYLQAWLRILERETPSEPKEEPEYKLVVTCSEKVKQLAKETVQLS